MIDKQKMVSISLRTGTEMVVGIGAVISLVLALIFFMISSHQTHNSGALEPAIVESQKRFRIFGWVTLVLSIVLFILAIILLMRKKGTGLTGPLYVRKV